MGGGKDLPSARVEVTESIRAGTGLDVGGDGFGDRGVDVFVDELDVEGGRVGAGH